MARLGRATAPPYTCAHVPVQCECHRGGGAPCPAMPPLAATAAGGGALRALVSEDSRLHVLHLPPGVEGSLDPPLPDPFLGVIDDDALRNLAELRECAQCGDMGRKLRRCKACRGVWYCCAACQKAHWRSHCDACRHSAVVIGVAGAAAAALLAHDP